MTVRHSSHIVCVCLWCKEESFTCELEFLQCELTVANEQSPADYYRKSAVEVGQHTVAMTRGVWSRDPKN